MNVYKTFRTGLVSSSLTSFLWLLGRDHSVLDSLPLVINVVAIYFALALLLVEFKPKD